MVVGGWTQRVVGLLYSETEKNGGFLLPKIYEKPLSLWSYKIASGIAPEERARLAANALPFPRAHLPAARLALVPLLASACADHHLIITSFLYPSSRPPPAVGGLGMPRPRQKMPRPRRAAGEIQSVMMRVALWTSTLV